ncbi:AraC family transcriptional regulator [Paenibacillus sp. NFR01]|uniref:AraC family transcriptional regulator n=1 Tax=Paenibacillus sp. NFR01 TaxID=1566279 RepID=UPI0008B83D8C|nr:AraC family transcriptional regulator [Paenibacillus sp. NFR01]SET34020.1 AraC family transcriptional regulator, arabinose operon regulatory protein [Paenibacillus sp. NFR01]
MNNVPACHVLSAGFSFHRKPFHMSRSEGVQSYLLRYQTEGRSRTMIDGAITTVETGDLMLFAPNDPYYLSIDKENHPTGKPRIESGDYHIFCGGPWIEEWWQQKQRPFVVHLPPSDNLLGILRQLVLEQRRLANFSPEISACYLQIFCMEIDRLTADQPSVTAKRHLAYRMKQYIEEHAALSLRLEDVAAHVDISVSRAVHLFKEAFNTTIVKYINEVRLEMARERITFSPLPLEHISETCGFANYTYFHRIFKNRFGMSPKEYRQTSRERNRQAVSSPAK